MLAALSDEGGDRGPAFQQLCLESFHLYASLLPELEATGIDLRYRRDGVLHVALNDDDAAHLRHRFEAQRDVAKGNRWLDRTEIAAEEPGVSSKVVAGLLSPEEHYLDPRRLTEALAEAARRHGATLRTGETVTSFITDGDLLRGVRTKSGLYEADAVLLAAGPWTERLAKPLGVSIPVRPVRGQMLSLRGPAQSLRHVIWGARAYLVPREEGQTFAGATVEEAGFRKRTTDPGLRGLIRGAIELIPSLAGSEVVRSWAGLRPATPDALPVMGLLPGWQNAWVATGHFRNGILLAPISGRLMAASILSGSADKTLAPFTPERFATQVAAVT
jgi:glycine oxidase